MPQDNTLGAPTEGLGQTVTFSQDPLASGQQGGLDYGSVRAQIVGGPAALQTKVLMPDTSHPLVDLASKVLGEAAKQEAKQERTARFLTGMQRAAAGDAIKDIAEEQPWYSKLFGESDVVEGARVYTAHQKAETLASTFEEAMPELSKLSPQEAQAYFTKTVQEQMTGDDATDLAVMQSISKTMPAVMKRHAKEHYGYLQREAVVAQQAAWTGSARTIRARANNLAKEMAFGPADATDLQAAVSSLKELMAPAPGQDIDNWRESVTSFLVSEAKSGNFHVLNGLRARGEGDPDLTRALTEKQRQAVESAAEAGENLQRNRYSYEWSDRLAEIETRAKLPQPGEKGEGTSAAIDALNLQYRVATGSTQGIITPEKKAALTAGTAEAIVREMQRQAAEAVRRQERADDLRRKDEERRQDKAEAAAMMDNAVTASIWSGGAGIAITTPGVRAKDFHAKVYETWKAQGAADGLLTPKQVFIMTRNLDSNYVNPQVQDLLVGQIQRQMGASEINEGFRGAAQNYKVLRQANLQAAHKYYGDMAPRMEAYLEALDAQIPEAEAFRENFMSMKRPPKIDTKDRAAAVKAVGDKDFLNRVSAWVGERVPLQRGQEHLIARHLKDAADNWVSYRGESIDSAYEYAYKEGNGKTFEVIGGYAVMKTKDQVSIESKLVNMAMPGADRTVGTDTVHAVMRDAVDGLVFGDHAEEYSAKDMASILVLRLDGTDPKSLPRFQVTGYVNGRAFKHMLDHTNIKAAVDKGKALRAKFDTLRDNPEAQADRPILGITD